MQKFRQTISNIYGDEKSTFSLNLIWLFLIVGLITFDLARSQHNHGIEGDIFWHYAVGKWILTHHQVPTTGVGMLNGNHISWIDVQWLPDLYYAVVGLKTGAVTMIIAAQLAIIIPIVVIYKKLPPLQFMLIGISAIFGITVLSAFRPQALLWLLYSIYVLLLTRHKWSSLYAIIPFIAIDLHGAFTMLFITQGIIWLTSPQHRTKHNFIVSVISVLVTLINPYTLNAYYYVYAHETSSTIYNQISEWQSPVMTPVMLIILFLPLVLLIINRTRINRGLFIAAIIMLTASVIIVRVIPFYLTTTFAAIYSIPNTPEINNRKEKVPRILAVAVLLLSIPMLVIAAKQIATTKVTQHITTYKVAQTASIDINGNRLIFTDPVTGDTAMYLNQPHLIDGRVLLANRLGQFITPIAIMRGQDNTWQQYMKRYNISVITITGQTQFGATVLPAINMLLNSNWITYQNPDNKQYIFVIKTNPKVQQLMKANNYVRAN